MVIEEVEHLRRATVENAGAGSRVKTRAADTLRGRFGPQSGQVPRVRARGP